MNELARVFKALGDPNRLRILAELYGTTFCVCDLARQVGLSQPTLSHHLRILRETGLVHAEKEGQWIYCTLNQQTFSDVGVDIVHLFERFPKEEVRG